MQIDYYFSTLSPFTYLAGLRLEEIAAKHGARISYRPMDVMALFARTGGTPVGERHPSRQAYRLQELARLSKKTGLPINVKPAFFPTNAAPSSYAVIAADQAQREGKADEGDLGALAHGLLRSCWYEEKDIAQDEVIGDCLEAAGFDRGLTLSGLLVGAENYARNTEQAVEAGVFGSPFYICEDGAAFWGQDRLEFLDAHLAGEL